MVIVLRFKMLFVATLMLALAVAPTSNAEDPGSDEKWEFYLQGYGWIAALDSTSANGDDISLSFKDILDNLDFGIMAGGGARQGSLVVECGPDLLETPALFG